jgi:hypothetical protein
MKTLTYQPGEGFIKWLRDSGELDVSQDVAELKAAIAQNSLDRTADRYDRMLEEKNWHIYYYRARRPAAEDSTPYIFNEQVKYTSHVLCGDESCKKVINFGAFCGIPDARLAEMFDDVQFDGIDRSQLIQFLNQQEFKAANLRFFASDIFRYLEDDKLEGALLSHARTTMFLYPAMLEKLYATAARRGVRYIVGVEFAGYSHELKKFYEFSGSPQASAVLRPGFFAHNYPEILARHNYELKICRLKPLPMRKAVQQDAHVLIFVAELKS